MAAQITDYVQEFNKATFEIDSASDISKLPTLTTPGNNELSKIGPVNQGSVALMSQEIGMYKLGGDGVWHKLI